MYYTRIYTHRHIQDIRFMELLKQIKQTSVPNYQSPIGLFKHHYPLDIMSTDK